MQEIKIRAWDMLANEWSQQIDDECICDINHKARNGELIIEQFTGLLDSKGREIYEGDILQVPYGWSGDYEEKAHLSVIEWDDCDMGFYFSHPDDVNIRECEIIGNVHENPTMIDYEIEKAKLDKQYPTR